MSRLIPVAYSKVVKALSRIGYVIDHQKGSHIVMYLKNDAVYSTRFGSRKPSIRVVVPAHTPIGKGLVRTIIRETGLSVEEFLKLL